MSDCERCIEKPHPGLGLNVVAGGWEYGVGMGVHKQERSRDGIGNVLSPLLARRMSFLSRRLPRALGKARNGLQCLVRSNPERSPKNEPLPLS